MSRYEYISELRSRISHLPREEQDAALTYYVEYLEDIGEENVQQAIDELGTPREVAEQIIADYASRCNEMNMGDKRNMSPNGCLIGIAVVTSPVWISLLIALGAVVLSIILVIAILFIVLVFCAVLFVGLGFFTLFADFGSGILLLGGALICAGLTGICFVPVAIIFMAIANKFKK